jgi:2-keto-3-deoxy-L-rhamnonate aldolase RhmA
MNFIRERVLRGEFMAGAWCNLGSSLTVEMAARIGYDWILLDQEHGPGDNLTLLHQMQAAQAGNTAPIVRIAWNEMPRFKRALDLGAMGIMVPYVQNPEEARLAVNSMRYSPEGIRGVASSPRVTGFGLEFDKYYGEANHKLLTVVQIETGESVANLESIAAVEGVDVLFVGPLDLSVSLNMPGRFDDPAFRKVLATVGEVSRAAGKAAGILLPGPELIEFVHSLGFTFVAAGADGGMVANGFSRVFEAMSSYK